MCAVACLFILVLLPRCPLGTADGMYVCGSVLQVLVLDRLEPWGAQSHLTGQKFRVQT
jgi:hypothetical protein